MPKFRLKISLRIKFIFITLGMILGVIVLTGYLSYSRAVTALEDELGNSLVSVASTGVLLIDGDKHTTLKTVDDENTATYKEMKKKLQLIRDINKAPYVYTLVPKDESNVIFVVDAAEGDDI